MAPNRKRRLDQRDPTPDDSADESPPQRRRRSSSSSSASSSASETSAHSAHTSSNSTAALAKKLVRLALSTEYSRTPLRRTDVSTKIFAHQANTRNFKAIFDLAQADLASKFGMQLVELPGREKVDLKSRRHLLSQSAKATGAGSTSSKSWILVSTLPPAYKINPVITTPTNAGGSHAAEASYTALYTFVVSVIYLNNGVLPDAKLERYLKRVNAETYTTIGATEKVLARMVKEGYVEKRRDTSTGEELIEWVVGPRGKVEVGIKGVTGLVKSVYGFQGALGEEGAEVDVDEEEEDLDRKLKRSLGIKDKGPRIVVDGGGGGGGAEAGNSDAEADSEEPTRRRRGRPRRAAATEEQSDDDA